MTAKLSRTVFKVVDYDLEATLNSGQAFRWNREGDGWTSVIGSRWVRLIQHSGSIAAETYGPPSTDWEWLIDYFQLRVDLPGVLASFPRDETLQQAVSACRGLRLLRQDLWECLASFILSSTKQIVQIRQIVASLCRCFGEPVAAPNGSIPMHSFPSAAIIAGCSEAELRGCKMGFRAPYLLETAQRIASGEFDLPALRGLPLDQARAQLVSLPGVGRKIADCVLLFGYGFDRAFPVDVWVLRALRRLYFRGRPVKRDKLQRFCETHFGPHAGYAQQYLFHYIRTKSPA